MQSEVLMLIRSRSGFDILLQKKDVEHLLQLLNVRICCFSFIIWVLINGCEDVTD